MPASYPALKNVRRPIVGPEIGASGFEHFSGRIVDPLEENTLFSDLTTACLTFHKMFLSNPKVSGSFLAIVGPLMNRKIWNIERASDNQSDRDAEEYAERVLFNNPKFFWSNAIFQFALNIIYGVMPFEMVFEAKEKQIEFRKFAVRLPHTIWEWQRNPDGSLKAITQQVQMPDGNWRMPVIPVEKLCLFTRWQIGDNYQGLSALRPLYYYWKGLKQALTALGIANQKTAVGVPIGKIPPSSYDTPDTANFLTALKNYGVGESEYMLETEGYEIRLEQPVSVADTLIRSIEFFSEEIPKGFLAQFIDLKSAAIGSNSDSMIRQLFISLQPYADNICEVINGQWMPMGVGWNFQTKEPLQLTVKPLTASFDRKDQIEFLEKMIPLGVAPIFREMREQLMKEMGFPDPDWNKIEREESLKKEQMQRNLGAINEGKAKQNSEEDPEEDPDEMPIAKMAEPEYFGQWKPMRPLRPSERYCSLAEINGFLESTEQRFARTIDPFQREMVDSALSSAERVYPDLERLTVSIPPKLITSATATLKEILDYGWNQVTLEHQRARAGVRVSMAESSPISSRADAISWIKNLLNRMMTFIKVDIESIIKMEMFRSSSRDIAKSVAIADMEEILTEAILDKTPMIYREAVSTSFNYGRGLGFDEVIDDLRHIEYSAILDGNQCPVCNKHDGQIVKLNSPEYFALMPPNRKCKSNRSKRGNRCRCMYVGVYKEELIPHV